MGDPFDNEDVAFAIGAAIDKQVYIRTLAREYLDLIARMKSGQYDEAERRELSSQRTNVHNELIRLLGDDYARPFDMKAHCRKLLA